MVSYLPVPEAAGPIAGAPGHFAHHDWLTASVKALDQLMAQRSILLQLSPAGAQTIASNTFVGMGLSSLMVKSPGCPAYTVTGSPSGVLTLGDSWPTGIYRVDWAVGWAAPTSPTYATSSRSSQLFVNGVVPATVPNIVNVAAPGQANRPALAAGFGAIFLKPLDTVSVNCRHDHSANLDTSPLASFLQLQYLFPTTMAISPV